MARKFEISGKQEAMYLFSHALRERLEDDGFTQNVHLAEPMYESTVFEYSKGEVTVVLTIDEDSLGGARLVLSSKEGDTGHFIQKAVSDVIAECIHTYLKPLTKKMERTEIIEKVEGLIEKSLNRGQ